MPVGDFDLTEEGKVHPPGGGRVGHERDAALARLAYDQHGVVARPQLLATGFSAIEVEVLIRRRRLHVLWPGVYAVGHKRLTHEGRCLGAVLACGTGAVLSHRSAAALLRIVDHHPSRIEVTTPHRTGSGQRRIGLHLHRTRRLDEDEVTARFGIAVTSPSRTLVDLASVLNARALLEAVHAAERVDLLDPNALSELCERSGGRRGIGHLRRIVATYRPLPETRSWLQDRYLRLCDDAGLPRPASDVVVEGLEVDCFWPEQGVVVELDSWGFHRHPDAFENDRKRDIALRLAGLIPLRFTHRRVVGEPHVVVAETIAALEASRRRPSEPGAG
jgi:hypothetical protein